MTDWQKGKKLKKIRMSSGCFPFQGFQGSQKPSPGESGMFVGSLWQVSVRLPVIRPMKATFWEMGGVEKNHPWEMNILNPQTWRRMEDDFPFLIG